MQTSHHTRPRSTLSSESYSDSFKPKSQVLSEKQFKKETRKLNPSNQQRGGSKDKKSHQGYNHLAGSHTYHKKTKYTQNSHGTQRHKKKDDSAKLERNYEESRNNHSASRYSPDDISSYSPPSRQIWKNQNFASVCKFE
ncbi:hypothetical protein BKA69DRAFT_1053697 [Paraphysoderma sedebokerense]|nr:hypothetical protein BKA69DRAFT_1053697 [Paraphysoderma sedebokerense]